MSAAAPISRRPAGTPTGGQFAETQRGEADVDLLADTAATPEPIGWQPPEPGTVKEDPLYPEWTGSKYTGWRDIASVATDVRKDLKDATNAGYLPRSVGGHDISYSVKVDKYAGGQSMRVEIRGIADRDIYGDPDSHLYRDVYGNRTRTDETKELNRKVARIASAYNQDSTNTQVDYFNTMYYCTVDIEDEDRADWRIKDKQMESYKKELREARKRGATHAEIDDIQARARATDAAHTQASHARNAREEEERRAWRARWDR